VPVKVNVVVESAKTGAADRRQIASNGNVNSLVTKKLP
jgi:hypothetical protein